MNNPLIKPSEDELTFEITQEDCDTFRRFDHFLAHKIPYYSRSFLKLIFEEGLITSDQEHRKLELKKMPPVGSWIEVELPPMLDGTAKAENIPLEILYEDPYLVFINKPVGMVTHPAPGHYTGTLVNAILHHCPDIIGVGTEKRPGIVHRLDKGTSGVMVIAKEQKTHEKLIETFAKHDLDRRYEALLIGATPNKEGILRSEIGRDLTNRQKMSTKTRKGRNAITHYKLLSSFGIIHHMEFKLETGRTHQIRVHSSELLKAPILLDELYGNPKQHLDRLDPSVKSILQDYAYPLLHAKRLSLKHPITGEQLTFEKGPPEIFKNTLLHLKTL